MLHILIISKLCITDEIGCFVHGECVESPYVEDWAVTSAQECLELCQQFDGCEYFTYLGLEDYCLGFSACVELGQDCQECYSGNASCPGNVLSHYSLKDLELSVSLSTDLQCWVRGSCYGILITEEHVGSDSECLDSCKNDLECNWFTYNDADGACILFESCDDFSADTCDTCWSGQRQCEERQGSTGYPLSITYVTVESLIFSSMANLSIVTNPWFILKDRS